MFNIANYELKLGAYIDITVIREIFVVKNFSFHPKQPKFLARILFTNHKYIHSEYMAHIDVLHENF